MIVLRIKIGVSDKDVIPACRHLVFTEPNGAQSTYIVQTVVEDFGDNPRWGHSCLHVFNHNGKRARSPSPEPRAPPQPSNYLPSSTAPPNPIQSNPITHLPPHTTSLQIQLPRPPFPLSYTPYLTGTASSEVNLTNILLPTPTPTLTQAMLPTNTQPSSSDPLPYLLTQSSPIPTPPLLSTYIPAPVQSNTSSLAIQSVEVPATEEPIPDPDLPIPGSDMPISVPEAPLPQPAALIPIPEIPLPEPAIPVPEEAIPIPVIPIPNPVPIALIPEIIIQPVPVNAVIAAPAPAAPAYAVNVANPKPAPARVPAPANAVPAPAAPAIAVNAAIQDPAPPRVPAPVSAPQTEEEIRHSLRLKLKGGSSKPRRGGRGGSSSGIPILSEFPYPSLSDQEIISLFEISGLKLGDSLDQKLTVVKHLRSLSRTRFQNACTEIISSRAPDAIAPILDIGQSILNTLPEDSPHSHD